MRNFGDSFNVGDVGIWIAKGLDNYGSRVVFKGGVERFEVVDVDDGVCNALICKCVGDEVVCAAIEIVGCNDMVATEDDILKCVCDGCCARGYCQTCYATFECCDAVFKNALCRVGQAAVDVAGVAEAEAVGGMLGVAKYVARGLVNWHGACVGCWVWVFLSYVKL